MFGSLPTVTYFCIEAHTHKHIHSLCKNAVTFIKLEFSCLIYLEAFRNGLIKKNPIWTMVRVPVCERNGWINQKDLFLCVFFEWQGGRWGVKWTALFLSRVLEYSLMSSEECVSSPSRGYLGCAVFCLGLQACHLRRNFPRRPWPNFKILASKCSKWQPRFS